MEYKLIKKYPSLPKDWEEGMIVGLGIGDKRLPNTFSPCNGKYKDYYVYYKEVTNNPEFWEEVIEKDYEILSLINPTINNSPIFERKNYNLEDWENTLALKHLEIYSVKRLSDGEIFTIGDKAQTIGKYPHSITSIQLKKDFYNNDRVWIHWEKDCGGNWLESIEKCKEKIFTTEDRVDIYEEDYYYVVYFEKERFGLPKGTDLFTVSKAHKAETLGRDETWSTNCKFFSKKEAAQEYVLMNKPLNISIKKLCPIIGQCNNTTYIDLDLLTKKLKELVKSEL